MSQMRDEVSIQRWNRKLLIFTTKSHCSRPAVLGEDRDPYGRRPWAPVVPAD